jgi:archaemetzincin
MWLTTRVRAALVMVVVACSSEPSKPPPSQVKATPPIDAGIPVDASPVGDVRHLAPELRRAFDPAVDFAPVGTPAAGDWLAAHPEPPQSFDDYVHSEPNVVTPQRHTIYLLPIGTFPKSAPPMTALSAIVHAYFTIDVQVLPAVPLAQLTAKSREHAGHRQLYAPDVLEWLATRVPDDAYALMAVTMEDLYPDPAWNFVFGMASLEARVGVQSFARQDPAFFGERRDAGWQQLALRRATWTLVHEISHMFGLAHCAFYRCVIAGSNSQDEADRAPLHACPVCLHKLWWVTRFDPAAREEALAKVLGELHIDDEAAWSARRARWIRTGERSPPP